VHSGSPCLGALAGQLLCEGFAVNPFLSQVIALTYADIGRECSLAGHPPDFPVGWLPGRKRSCIWSVISGSPFQISSLTTHLRFEGADTSSRTHPDRVLLLEGSGFRGASRRATALHVPLVLTFSFCLRFYNAKSKTASSAPHSVQTKLTASLSR
jgi:hypothetical protein